MDFMGWLQGIVDASTNVSSPPGEGTVSVMNAMIPKAIWDNNTLTAGFALGLVITLFVGYTRSPWRRLPLGPRRLPILGNALHLRDKSWLLSKDCKQRFGEFPNRVTKDILKVCLRNLQERLCTSTGLDNPSLYVTVLGQLSNCSSAVRPIIRIVLGSLWARRSLAAVCYFH